jgi:polysaccharide export outer membrane protein
LANYYRLGSKDRVRLIVFGEEDLSGEFEVDGSGVIAMPLVGQVAAAGKTLRELEEAVAAKLREGYLNDPRVSAEVLNYRPFYIFGEVVNGGEYSFTDGMSLLNAVAVAGGYTYRADQRRVFITRADGSGEREYTTGAPVPVLPGDIIKIPERFF